MKFSEKMKNAIPNISDDSIEKFRIYYELLVEWNEKMNLTAITDEDEVICKHFADSVLPMSFIPENAHCIDVGTGAGFPGVPLLIMRSDIEMVLLDSLNKRLIFLNELLSRLGILAETVHGRVEDIAQDAKYRESFDVSLTRAVASVSVLAEWTAPLITVGGKTIMYKSASASEELATADNALSLLSLTADVESFDVPWGERCVIVATKHRKTPSRYPRKAGLAKKDPL